MAIFLHGEKLVEPVKYQTKMFAKRGQKPCCAQIVRPCLLVRRCWFKTTRELLKSAPYLRHKKLFEIVKGGPFGFFEKKKNRKIRILSQSHSAEKLERGDPLGFLKLQFAVKYQKTWRGDPLETKFRKKIAQCRKKLKPYSLVLFCIWR